jgi:hypothetical protein
LSIGSSRPRGVADIRGMVVLMIFSLDPLPGWRVRLIDAPMSVKGSDESFNF